MTSFLRGFADCAGVALLLASFWLLFNYDRVQYHRCINTAATNSTSTSVCEKIKSFDD